MGMKFSATHHHAWQTSRLHVRHSVSEQVECRDATDLLGWDSSQSEEPCFLLLMEVLDNCPHDRVHRESTSNPWLQTAVIQKQVSAHATLVCAAVWWHSLCPL